MRTIKLDTRDHRGKKFLGYFKELRNDYGYFYGYEVAVSLAEPEPGWSQCLFETIIHYDECQCDFCNHIGTVEYQISTVGPFPSDVSR